MPKRTECLVSDEREELWVVGAPPCSPTGPQFGSAVDWPRTAELSAVIGRTQVALRSNAANNTVLVLVNPYPLTRRNSLYRAARGWGPRPLEQPADRADEVRQAGSIKTIEQIVRGEAGVPGRRPAL